MMAEALEECRPEFELLSWATLLRSRDLESLVDIILSATARDVTIKYLFFLPRCELVLLTWCLPKRLEKGYLVKKAP